MRIYFFFISLFILQPFSQAQEDIHYSDYIQKLQVIDIDSRKIAFYESGKQNQNVALFLHGTPTNSWSYRKVIKQLETKSNFHIVAPDLLGYGQSSKPRKKKLYKLKNQANLIIRLIKELRLQEKKITLIAHDMGGGVTWELLKESPDLISNLLVLNTFLYEDLWTPTLKIHERFGMRSIMAMPFGHNMYIKSFLKTSVLEKNFINSEEKKGYTGPGRGVRFPYMQFIECVNKVRDTKLESYQDAFFNFQGNVAVIWGQHDEWLLSQHYERMSAHPNFVHGQILENAKHLIMEEEPNSIVRAILKLNN